MVGANELLAGHVVHSHRDSLCQPPVVHEDERAVMRPDLLQQAGVDGRPDRSPRLRSVPLVDRELQVAALSRVGHVVERNDDLQIERRRLPGIDDLDPTCASEVPSDFLQRPLRRRESDPLRWLSAEMLEPLKRKR